MTTPLEQKQAAEIAQLRIELGIALTLIEDFGKELLQTMVDMQTGLNQAVAELPMEMAKLSNYVANTRRQLGIVEEPR